MSEIPHVTRERLKIINADSTEIGDGSDTRPTEKERAWLELIRSTDVSRDVMRKRAAVCALADVVSMTPERVTIAYDATEYALEKPINGFRIARAREVSIMAALEELNAQRCIKKGVVPINKDFANIDAAVIKLLGDVAENFFFTPFL